MAEQKTKPVTKKVVAAQPKAKTASVVAGKMKAAVATAKTPAKKVVAKKTVAATTEAKKTRSVAVKKVPVSLAETKAPVKAKPAAASKAKNKPKNKPKNILSPEERYRMVQMAAYFIAERHGFQGRSDAHWAAAEQEIANKLDK